MEYELDTSTPIQLPAGYCPKVVLAQNILRYCKVRGWSFRRLEIETGIPKATLHDWVHGRRVRDLLHLKRLANVFKVPLYQLLYQEEDPHGQKICTISGAK